MVQGKSGHVDIENVLLLEYTDGKWLLDDIQEGGLSLEIAKTPDVIPDNHRITV